MSQLSLSLQPLVGQGAASGVSLGLRFCGLWVNKSRTAIQGQVGSLTHSTMQEPQYM